MKKILYILLAINIFALAIAFFMLLSKSLWLAFVYLGIGAIGLVPTLAIIRCLDDVEDLHYQVTVLYEKLRKFENGNQEEIPFQNPEPFAHYGDKSDLTWKCIKCDTINKAGTTNCSNCNAEYSQELNPTYISNPKKLSRFLKEKNQRPPRY